MCSDRDSCFRQDLHVFSTTVVASVKLCRSTAFSSALVEKWALVDRGKISIEGIKKGRHEICGRLENDKIL